MIGHLCGAGDDSYAAEGAPQGGAAGTDGSK